MSSKLSDYCDRVLEAGWLIALIVAPLFFNVYSDRVFEPDKLRIVRSLALVMVAAWGTRALDGMLRGGRPDLRGLPARIRQTPLVLPTLLMVLAYLISTAFSIVPRISFWGSYQRLQGTYTTFSYIRDVLHGAEHTPRREQVDRLLNVIVLTSMPMPSYGSCSITSAIPSPGAAM